VSPFVDVSRLVSHFGVFMTFLEFCRKNGCELLKDDVTFIKKCLSTFSKGRHKIILRVYVDVWVKAMADCKNISMKQNAGRRAANLYLLGEVDETSRNS
jgi:hypothetical protein